MKFTISIITAFAALAAAAPAEHRVTWDLPIICGTDSPFLMPCPPTPTPTTTHAPELLTPFAASAPCTTTFWTNVPHRHSMRMFYSSTVTATETVDCRGCEATSMDWRSSHHWGHGPAVADISTMEVTTTTEWVCAASPTN